MKCRTDVVYKVSLYLLNHLICSLSVIILSGNVKAHWVLDLQKVVGSCYFGTVTYLLIYFNSDFACDDAMLRCYWRETWQYCWLEETWCHWHDQLLSEHNQSVWCRRSVSVARYSTVILISVAVIYYRMSNNIIFYVIYLSFGFATVCITINYLSHSYSI